VRELKNVVTRIALLDVRDRREIFDVTWPFPFLGHVGTRTTRRVSARRANTRERSDAAGRRRTLPLRGIALAVGPLMIRSTLSGLLSAMVVALATGGCAAAQGEPAEADADVVGGGARFRMLGIDDAPRQVLLSISPADRGFAAELYDAVQKINEAEKLSGTEGPNAAISVVAQLAGDDGVDADGKDGDVGPAAADVLAQLEEEIRTSRRLAAGAPIPNLSILRSTVAPTFVQDRFELFAPTGPGARREPLAAVDLTALDDESMTTPAFMRAVGATPLPARFGLGRGRAVIDGGNLEVTHEGRPYVGSTAPAAFREALERLTGQPPIVLPVDWLFVGHVDEYVTILPSSNACGATLVHSDPLEGINIIRQRKDPPLIPREDVEGEGKTSVDEALARRQFASSLAYFTRPGSAQKATLQIEDFDLDKPVRGVEDAADHMDQELLLNLQAQAQIAKGVAALKDGSKCLKETVALPAFFYMPHFQPTLTAGSGYMNLVSVRNHVILAKERKEYFGPIVRERLGKLLGSPSRVHQVEASYLEAGQGSVHCATQVIRAAERWR